MKFLIATFLFFVSTSTAAEVAIQYSSLVDAFAIEQNPCDNIRNGQFICKDCRTMAFCAQTANGWETVSIGTCSDSLFCDEAVHGCTFKLECPLSNRGPRFQCQNPGTFPDPYECKYYHECSANNQDERKVCPSGQAYSTATKSCSLTSNDAICYTPQYDCPTFGYMAAWPSDENIYYVCGVFTVENGQMVQYPMLYRCPDGQIFKNNKCISASGNTPPSPGATNCSPNGNLVADPNDCHSYSVCVQGQLVGTTCPAGSYFETVSATCQIGTC